MDLPRPNEARRRRRRRILEAALGLLAIAAVSVGLSRLKPAAPMVEGTYPGTVKRGPMLREVGGPGVLLPEDIRWIPAMNSGRVEVIHVLAGAPVKADTILLELSNPELMQAAFDA